MELINEILYRPLFNALIFLYNTIAFHDLGIAIIYLTVIIRLILWPSQAKALRSQKELQKVQPELEELRKKHKDKQKQTQAILELYKKKKVSPFASCLPTLIQLPIIIALYSVFRNSLNKEALNALYPFISRPESINSISLGILDLSRPEKYVLPFLTGGLQLIQSVMMMRRTTTPGAKDPAQMMTKQMMYIFPIMTVIIAMTLPAALPLYWIVTTLFAILQQWLVFRDSKPMPQQKQKPGRGGVRVKVRRK